MGDRYDDMVRRLRDAVLRGEGDTGTPVRAAIEARAAGRGGVAGGVEKGAGVPEPVMAFVDKVARHAYRVTDEDVEALRAAGYGEDAIFEITVSAALGAGCVRLERGLSALRAEI